jgi:hypothetical protein
MAIIIYIIYYGNISSIIIYYNSQIDILPPDWGWQELQGAVSAEAGERVKITTLWLI